jgi:hypothetical protein
LRAHLSIDPSGAKSIEAWLNARRKSLKLLQWEHKDEASENALDLRLNFSSDPPARNFVGQLVGNHFEEKSF